MVFVLVGWIGCIFLDVQVQVQAQPGNASVSWTDG